MRTNAPPLLMLIACALAMPNIAGALEKTVHSDEELAHFLQKGRRVEAVEIRSLNIHQGNQTCILYDAVGREEIRQRLQRRPILTPALHPGWFSRGTRYWILVDRSQPFTLRLKMNCFQAGSTPETIERHPITRVRLLLSPDWKQGQYHPLSSGELALDLPAGFTTGSILIQVTSHEKHTLEFILWNKDRPVTFQK